MEDFDNQIVIAITTYSEESARAVAKLGGEPIGWAAIIPGDTSPVYVERLDVEEAYRGRGVGTKMLKVISAHFGGLIIAADNADADRLYSRLGSAYHGEAADYIDQGFGVWQM